MDLEHRNTCSKLIMVRHGESAYTNCFPDLTDRGLDQITKMARVLRSDIKRCARLIVCASPAPRAIGSMYVFFDALGKPYQPVVIDPDLSPVRFRDYQKFSEYDKSNSTPVFGELWLTDPYLASDNDLAEGRLSVEARGHNFVKRTINCLKKERPGLLILSFTHMEVMAPFMKMLRDGEKFPSKSFPCPGNGETVTFWASGNNVSIEARGRLVNMLSI